VINSSTAGSVRLAVHSMLAARSLQLQSSATLCCCDVHLSVKLLAGCIALANCLKHLLKPAVAALSVKPER
jgi:hypothetical protein